MSIAPPSDIILDVAQAADPTRRDAAVARLAQLANRDAGDFTASLATLGSPPAGSVVSRPDVRPGDIGTGGAPQHASRTLSPFQKFEAVLLQNFLQSTLPKDDELFGDAASADTVRSMLAEQLANQMAASGRFGIAKMLDKHAAQAAAAAGAPATAVTPADLRKVSADPLASFRLGATGAVVGPTRVSNPAVAANG